MTNKTPAATIKIDGAREHNLKNVSLEIPKNKLVVFTGLSGSGKSSLAFDTLYAEGQRRYVESLSSYARQFLGIMKKPEVDQVDGLSPAISIDQKTTSHNPRSTVGTITEIYDYLRLLYARIGHPSCPNCGRPVSTQSVDQILEQVMQHLPKLMTDGHARLAMLAPIVRDKKGAFENLFQRLLKQGYTRVRVDGQFFHLENNIGLIKTNKHSISVVVDRLSISRKQLKHQQEKKDLVSKLTRAIEESLHLADGFVIVSIIEDAGFNFPDQPKQFQDLLFSEKLACSHCSISLSEPQPRLFSFNSPHGACPTCNGLGSILKIDQDKIIAQELTLSEGAVIPFARALSSDTWWSRLVQQVIKEQGFDFRVTKYQDLDQATQQLMMHGSDKIYQVSGENRHGRVTVIEEKFEGFVNNLERRYHQTESEFMRKEIGQYMQKHTCTECQGARLNQEALAVKIDQLNISQVASLATTQAVEWIRQLQTSDILTAKESLIAKAILKEVAARLTFLVSVGLDYLTLDREAGTLAGGEAQRIRLASQIGTGLSGVLYILDEPTIGLHQRDNRRLIETLKTLRDKGNSVLVVEHDQEVILSADHLVDFGPGAGTAGGEIVATGTPQDIIKSRHSITGKYLSGKKKVKRNGRVASLSAPLVVPIDQAIDSGSIRLTGATHHNLNSIDVEFPLGKLIAITGVSGSGKSTLLHDTLYYQLVEFFGHKADQKPGKVEQIMVPEVVRRVSLIDQKPIGKTPRSNPATYSKSFDYIRQLFSNTREAKIRGYKPGRFSFNTKGGRCETCRGDGQLKIEMQFLPDVYITCDVCDGKRYNQETLAVEYRGKTIAQVLAMSVDEAFEFFSHHSALSKKLGTLKDVGLGYIGLGQPAPTLSGGEAQRLKLAKELSNQNLSHNVYLLDEPTTGLHFADVQKLLNVLSALVAHNNTVIVIEHNLDIIGNADWVIDLGPEGGEGGGNVVFTGTPIDLASSKKSITGKYL